MWAKYGRGWRWGLLGVLVVATAGAGYWLVTTTRKPPPARVGRGFPAAGVKEVILRGGTVAVEVIAVPEAEVIEVSGVPTGGAEGYHPSDPNWRETPAGEWGLDFVSARHGDVLAISTQNEIHYIHHSYVLQSVVLRVPAGVRVVWERRELTGDGAPDLSTPRP